MRPTDWYAVRPVWAEYWGPPKPAAVMVVVAQIHGNECSPTLLIDEVEWETA